MSLNHKWPRQTVGIFSRCPKSNCQWLINELRSNFHEIVMDVRYHQITNTNTYRLEEETTKCSVGILYHSTKHGRISITDIESSIYNDELHYMSKYFGKNKVMVVLDDIEKTDDLHLQPSLYQWSGLQLLIPTLSKEEALLKELETVSKFLQPEKRSEMKEKQPRNTSDLKVSRKRMQPSDNSSYENSSKKTARPELLGRPKQSIGVFSRSAKTNYRWLVEQLESKDFADVVKEVNSIEISNNYNRFSSHMDKCTFAILYHTQRDGRMNITDVPDSLYDRELSDLSQRLGKEKVFVVIDDFNRESSLMEKEKILREQFSIGQWAQELFLFSETEKTNRKFNSETVKDKIKMMKEVIERSIKCMTTFPSISDEQKPTRDTFEERVPEVPMPTRDIGSVHTPPTRGLEVTDANNLGSKMDTMINLLETFCTHVSSLNHQFEEFRKEQRDFHSQLLEVLKVSHGPCAQPPHLESSSVDNNPSSSSSTVDRTAPSSVVKKPKSFWK